MKQEWSERFITLARAKFDRGQAEHGGSILDRDLLKDMEDETIDLWHYCQARRLVGQGLTSLPSDTAREAAVNRWREVVAMLERQPAERNDLGPEEYHVASIWLWVQQQRRDTRGG